MSHGLFYRCPWYVSGSGNSQISLKNILNCVPKINEGLTGLERYEGE